MTRFAGALVGGVVVALAVVSFAGPTAARADTAPPPEPRPIEAEVVLAAGRSVRRSPTGRPR